jgi:hypothetical protein
MDTLLYICFLIGILGFIALFIPTHHRKDKSNKTSIQH